MSPKSPTREWHITLVPRTRSSHHIAAGTVANFGFKSGTGIIDFLVSFSIPKFAQKSRQMLANFGIGTPGAAVSAAARRPAGRGRHTRFTSPTPSSLSVERPIEFQKLAVDDRDAATVEAIAWKIARERILRRGGAVAALAGTRRKRDRH